MKSLLAVVLLACSFGSFAGTEVTCIMNGAYDNERVVKYTPEQVEGFLVAAEGRTIIRLKDGTKIVYNSAVQCQIIEK